MARSGRPKTDTQPMSLRMKTETLKRLDNARRKIDDIPTRPELVRRIVEEWLEKMEKG